MCTLIYQRIIASPMLAINYLYLFGVALYKHNKILSLWKIRNLCSLLPLPLTFLLNRRGL